MKNITTALQQFNDYNTESLKALLVGEDVRVSNKAGDLVATVTSSEVSVKNSQNFSKFTLFFIMDIIKYL